MPLKLFGTDCRVRVKAGIAGLSGECGTISWRGYGQWDWVVKLDNKSSYSFKEQELEMIHADD